MALVSEFLAAVLATEGSTVTLLLLIVGSATYVVRNQIASVFTLLFMSPMAMMVSMATYVMFVKLGLFNLKNMGEWLIWTIAAGTMGVGTVLGASAFLATMADRKEARLASR